MKYVALNLKLHPSKMARLNRYRVQADGEKISQLDYAKLAVDEKCDQAQLLRSGGLVLAIPNPTIGEHGTPGMIEERHKKVIEILEATERALTEAGFYNNGLEEYVEWLRYLYFDASELQRLKFEFNLFDDSKFETSTAAKLPEEWDAERGKDE